MERKVYRFKDHPRIKRLLAGREAMLKLLVSHGAKEQNLTIDFETKLEELKAEYAEKVADLTEDYESTMRVLIQLPK